MKFNFSRQNVTVVDQFQSFFRLQKALKSTKMVNKFKGKRNFQDRVYATCEDASGSISEQSKK